MSTLPSSVIFSVRHFCVHWRLLCPWWPCRSSACPLPGGMSSGFQNMAICPCPYSQLPQLFAQPCWPPLLGRLVSVHKAISTVFTYRHRLLSPLHELPCMLWFGVLPCH